MKSYPPMPWQKRSHLLFPWYVIQKRYTTYYIITNPLSLLDSAPFQIFFLFSQVTKVAATNNNAPKTQINVAGGSSLTSTVRPVTSVTQQNLTRTVGNNKTCNWVFENGEVCGKTFAKSYNLVVHMRMHEDVRPFGCSFCDQTFRYALYPKRNINIFIIISFG